MNCADHDRLIDKLAESDALPPDWAPAFRRVPRHLFTPDTIWLETESGLTAISRTDDLDRWRKAICSDVPLVTQINDGAAPASRPGTISSSSCSKPSVVAMMLARSEICDGMRVLEIGTGTGWNAALLSCRLGDGQVTTVEVDPCLAENARAALHRAGYRPTVVTGDGAAGHRPTAPYDRVLATCAVHTVPYPWVEQAVPGGLIITPWGNDFENRYLLRLAVNDQGDAHGRFVDNTVAFMWLREQRVTRGWLAAHAADDVPWQESVTTLHPYSINYPGAACAPALRVPNCQYRLYDDGELWLYDPTDGSRATTTVQPDARRWVIRQYGPRQLWDEIESVYTWWDSLGQPDYTRFGITVTAGGQWPWLDEPHHRIA